MLTEHQTERIKSSCSYFSKCKNITEWDYTLKKLETNSQNYFGELLPIVFTCKELNEQEFYHFILKLAPDDERYRVSNAITLFFAKEIFTYDTILKKYQEILQGWNKSDVLFPCCYFTCKDYCKEALLIQDMTVQGYKPFNLSFLDIHHAEEAVKALAKFHALSFILENNDRALYKEISEYCVPLNTTTNKRFLDILLDRLEKAITKFEGTNYETLFENLKANYIEYVMMQYENVNEVVICHGDIWKENILFKYVDAKPVSACLIDFQTVRMCSPAYDVLYLIASSTDSNLRRSHFHHLLKTYYIILEEHLQSAGLEAKQVYSETKFYEDIKKVSRSCLIIVNTAHWLFNGMQQEGHVRSKKIPRSEVERQEFENSYKSVIRDLVDDFKSYGYLV